MAEQDTDDAAGGTLCRQAARPEPHRPPRNTPQLMFPLQRFRGFLQVALHLK